jgi:hypothetical protein
MTKHLAEEQLVAFRFGYAETDEAAAIEEHLGACEACRATLGAIDATLSAVDQVPVPERSEGYGAEVWARIQPRLERPAPAWRAALQSLLAPRRLAFAGGVAVLVLAAFVAGRYSPRPGPRMATSQGAQQAGGKSTAAQASTASATPQVRQEILLVAVGDHLERSQIALAELVNTANAPRVDISSEQERARDLVIENRLYRQTAQETGDATLAAALDDLERVLVEVANSPSELSKAEFEGVRQRIEAQGIIFKVRVLGERVRDQQIRPAAGGRIQG